VLPAELTRVNGRAPRSPRGRWPWGAGGCSAGQNSSRIPPASYGVHGEEAWEASTDISQRDSQHTRSQPVQAAAWPGPQQTHRSPGRQGRWDTPGAAPSWRGWKRKGPLCHLPNSKLLLLAPAAARSPALHQYSTICLQFGIGLWLHRHHSNQTAAQTLLTSHPHGKAARQTHPAPPACAAQPAGSHKPSHYLFKCSSRKRKVMRLGSGRERRRCIMQFSLAAGSERAGDKEGEGSGQGLVTSGAAAGPTMARCLPAGSA